MRDYDIVGGYQANGRPANFVKRLFREFVKITDEVANIKINSYSDSWKKMDIKMFVFLIAEL